MNMTLPPTDHLRLIAGFLMTPPIVSCLGFLLLNASAGAGAPAHLHAITIHLVIRAALIFSPVAYAMTIILAIPLYLVLRLYFLSSLLNVVAVGGIIGAFGGLILFEEDVNNFAVHAYITDFILTTCVGASGGLIFWFVAFCRLTTPALRHNRR